jgi:tRNA threonylcarbamoyladenosine biosynthesis protein TsaE
VGEVVDEAGLAARAAALAAQLQPGDVVHLRGELGSGKTTFVRHAAAALGVREAVTSPTFAIAHRYGGGRAPVSHLDLYRAQRMTAEELADLDPYLDEAAIIFVEWPDAGQGALPGATVVIELAHAGEGRRRVHVRRVD